MVRLYFVLALLLGACSSTSGCEGRSRVDRGSEGVVDARRRSERAAFDEAGEASGLDAGQGVVLDGGAARDADAREVLRVAVVADLNGAYGSATYGEPVHVAVRRIVELRPDLVVSVGDMVAGQRSGLDYRAMWAGFFSVVADPLAAAGIPLAVTPGTRPSRRRSGPRRRPRRR